MVSSKLNFTSLFLFNQPVVQLRFEDCTQGLKSSTLLSRGRNDETIEMMKQLRKLYQVLVKSTYHHLQRKLALTMLHKADQLSLVVSYGHLAPSVYAITAKHMA